MLAVDLFDPGWRHGGKDGGGSAGHGCGPPLTRCSRIRSSPSVVVAGQKRRRLADAQRGGRTGNRDCLRDVLPASAADLESSRVRNIDAGLHGGMCVEIVV